MSAAETGYRDAAGESFPMTPARAALFAGMAEDMADGSLAPALDSRIALEWALVGHLIASDATLLQQFFGVSTPVYFGFVARSTEDPSQHIAVVRGTDSKSATEWLEDCDAVPVMGPIKGRVAHGFWRLYSSMTFNGQPAALGIDAAVLARSTMTFIGHSLGGPLATYLMLDYGRRRNRGGTARGMLFASPKPGDAAFAECVDAIVGPKNYKVYNYLRDIVPHMPPSQLGYRSLTNEELIRPFSARVQIKNDPLCNHHATSYAAMLGAVLSNGCILGGVNP
jgi:triacylglycerol lipase